VNRRSSSHLDYIDKSKLGQRGRTGWFAGLSSALRHVQMSFPLEVCSAPARGWMKNGPTWTAFLQRIHERPAYKRAAEARRLSTASSAENGIEPSFVTEFHVSANKIAEVQLR